jgi:hypothetical protein
VNKDAAKDILNHGWVFEYGNTVHAASTIKGKEKPDMWDALPTLTVLFQGTSIATQLTISLIECIEN